MATKAELGSARDEYYRCLDRARSSCSDCNYQQALDWCINSFPFIDEMMQFERKHLNGNHSEIESISLALYLGPLILNQKCLVEVASLLTACKRIEKNTTANIAAELQIARQRLWVAHRFWKMLTKNGATNNDDISTILEDHENLRIQLISTWDKLGLVRIVDDAGPSRIELVTNLNELTSAKCPACGAIGKARKAKLLEEVSCPKCKSRVVFVQIVST